MTVNDEEDEEIAALVTLLHITPAGYFCRSQFTFFHFFNKCPQVLLEAPARRKSQRWNQPRGFILIHKAAPA